MNVALLGVALAEVEGRSAYPMHEPSRLSRVLAGFLGAVALLQFGYPLTLHGELWASLYMLVYAVMVFLGIRLVRPEDEQLRPVVIVSTAFLVFGIWSAFDPWNALARLGMFTTVVLFQGYLIRALVVFVFRHRDARGPELILAAICVYLLLGGLFSAVFGVVETLWPGSFEDALTPGEPVAWQQLMYFSYVNLVTLGYGEVVPVTAWARSLSVAEAVIGTLFLTTVIARLVGAYISLSEPGDSGRSE